MLVARRDPFHPGAHDDSFPHAAASPQRRGSSFSRALTVLQMVGALLALPVGIGSAYTMYQSTFSPEATCKALRVNIVRMLDKNVDAGTRHMLVRRDVEAFERTCGAIDPDATAAFKALLAAEKALAPVATVAAPLAEPHPVPRKVEAAQKTKQQPARASAVAATPATAQVQREMPVSDADWVTAVRSALIKHKAEAAAAPDTPAPTSLAPPPHTLGALPAPSALPAAPLAAPVLPPPTSVAASPAPEVVDADHPVPPAAIPETAESSNAPRSRLGALVEEIPFVGKTIADRIAR